jgi:hypothetical protein
MSSKFEQLLDYLVNEETDKANELFHEIVVEKSREIYENLIAEEEEEDKMEEASEEDDDAMEEASEDDDDAMEESYEEESVEAMGGEEEFPVQDQTDDFASDTEADMGDEMDGEEDEEGSSAPADKGDIQDLEDALEELKAEFEALMAGEKHEEEENPDVHGGELDGFGDEESEEDGEEEEDEGEKKEGNPFAEGKIARTQGEKMREYIEKVSVSMVDGGGVGSGTGDKAGQTGHDAGKSPVSSGSGKPTSGANAKNVAQAGTGSNEDGTSPKGKVGGLVKTGGDFVKAGTKNVASSANAKKPDGSKLSGVSKPGNAEGKPVGAGTGQSNVSGATNTRSIESGK